MCYQYVVLSGIADAQDQCLTEPNVDLLHIIRQPGTRIMYTSSNNTDHI